MSAEIREALIEEMLEGQPSARLAMLAQPSSMIAGSWDLVAYSYSRAFDALWDSAQRDTSGLLTLPLLMLWRQSVELSIKSAIVETDGGLDPGAGHDLSALFEQLLAARALRGNHDDDEYVRDVKDTIRMVQEVDRFADRFRYPQTRKGVPYPWVEIDLRQLYRAHWTITTWCEGAALEAEASHSGDSVR